METKSSLIVPESKALLSVPDAARDIHVQIVGKLKALSMQAYESCLDKGFVGAFDEVRHLFDSYQAEVLRKSQYAKTCAQGCAHCCHHWVEDVNSFEAQIVAEYVRQNLSERIPAIVSACKSDMLMLNRLDKIVSKKLAESSEDYGDPVDVLLSSFYQLQRPCPLLDEHSRCSVYPVRPMTCRVYMSFSDSSRCCPDYINEGDIPTYLLDLNEDANEILDILHFAYERFAGDTGLRSLIAKHLESECGAPIHPLRVSR